MEQLMAPPVLHVYDAMEKVIEFVYSFIPYAEKTVILVPPILRTYITKISDIVSFEEDVMNMVLCLFLCYPLGLIMNVLPYGRIRHLFSFLLGVFLLQFTVRQQWVHHMITSLICYTLFRILPSRCCKTIIPMFLMIYMTSGHLHRQYINYRGWDMDFTSAQMVLTIKLYSLAYNLYDGNVLQTEDNPSRATKKCAHLAIPELPGFIEYLGYTFCFSSILAGPAYEYTYYASACDGSKLYNKNGKLHGKMPSNIWPTLRALIGSIFYLGVFVIGSSYVPFLDPENPQRNIPAILQPSFLAKPWIHRFIYMWTALFFIKCKFYFIWKNTEGANNIWFAGFDGFDENGQALGWETSVNIDVLAVETAPNIRTCMASWNKKTANWLGRYVYMRTSGNLFATYALSAFWHGFYPGYYMTFLSMPIVTFCERIGREKISPYFHDSVAWMRLLYNGICVICTSYMLIYICISFHLLSFDWAIMGWSSQYFCGHILCVLFYIVVSLLPTPKRKKME